MILRTAHPSVKPDADFLACEGSTPDRRSASRCRHRDARAQRRFPPAPGASRRRARRAWPRRRRRRRPRRRGARRPGSIRRRAFLVRRHEPGLAQHVGEPDAPVAHLGGSSTCSGTSVGASCDLEHLVELGLGRRPRTVAVVQVDDRAARGAASASTGRRHPRQSPTTSSTRSGCQPVVSGKYAGMQLVGERHELAELLGRRLGDADVVAERLRHLLLAVEARRAAAS